MRRSTIFILAAVAGLALALFVVQKKAGAITFAKKPNLDADGRPAPGPGYVLRPGFDGRMVWVKASDAPYILF